MRKTIYTCDVCGVMQETSGALALLTVQAALPYDNDPTIHYDEVCIACRNAAVSAVLKTLSDRSPE